LLGTAKHIVYSGLGRSAAGKPGVPTPVLKEIRKLIRQLSRENPLWGAPRIHGELKLGIDIGETSVGKYMVRRRNPPSQTWRTFLENHLKSTVSMTSSVPTLRFQVLYVFLVLAHDRRHVEIDRGCRAEVSRPD
jgi:putative transposase